MSPARTITLRKTSTGWVSTWTANGKPDREILALFGSDTIPTAFGCAAPASVVVDTIQRLNPECVVETVEASQ
jgi:hypothetical protein